MKMLLFYFSQQDKTLSFFFLALFLMGQWREWRSCLWPISHLGLLKRTRHWFWVSAQPGSKENTEDFSPCSWRPHHFVGSFPWVVSSNSSLGLELACFVFREEELQTHSHTHTHTLIHVNGAAGVSLVLRAKVFLTLGHHKNGWELILYKQFKHTTAKSESFTSFTFFTSNLQTPPPLSPSH